ncbi:MAG: virulence-associated E family protein [Roseiarcus sp.]|jgi:predicted P-loop ATPase
MSAARKRSEPAWLEDGVRDDRGQLIANLANAMRALRNDPALSTCFARDEMLRDVLLIKELPATGSRSADNRPDSLPRPVRDTDATRVQEYLQRLGLPRIGKDAIFQAIDLRADERAFHPIRDYLAGLKWDGQRRADEWLSRYLGADSSLYVDAIGEMFLTAMVQRIFEPGCQADYMLVLEGPQGSGKSSACRILGGDYFTDSLPSVRLDKEASNHLRGKWIVEIAELSAIRGAEEAALKAFLSRTSERYRPAYGRREVVEPRQCLFIGTTNESTYLHDETGGRRFWPVKTGAIDLAALAADRDQLFAEAVALHREGMQTYPDAEFERKHIKPVQEARREIDAWDEPIANFLARKADASSSQGKHGASVTVGEVATGALDMKAQRIATSDTRRITSIMASHGWRRSDKLRDGVRPWIAPNLHLVA